VPQERELFWQVAGAWLVLGGALSVLGALWMARRINRPLRTLAHAAIQVGHGETPHDLPERGPTEIAALSRAFNQMTRDVQRLTAERTLLLAGVSHDLRTPLARLRLALEMLDENADTALKQGMVQDVDDMDRIIEQFLAYVRDGEMESVRQADLNELVQATGARYLRQGHAIALDLTPLPLLAMRTVAMQRLVSNLIDNALRHGGGTVEVRTHMFDGRIALSVLDRGPGLPSMPSDNQAFSHRLHLGLVVVERIAQLHHGRLQLLPRDGGGLEARVELAVPALEK
jgi:two-component system osmolarity sensor histidine kinase EnvZ